MSGPWKLLISAMLVFDAVMFIRAESFVSSADFLDIRDKELKEGNIYRYMLHLQPMTFDDATFLCRKLFHGKVTSTTLAARQLAMSVIKATTEEQKPEIWMHTSKDGHHYVYEKEGCPDYMSHPSEEKARHFSLCQTTTHRSMEPLEKLTECDKDRLETILRGSEKRPTSELDEYTKDNPDKIHIFYTEQSTFRLDGFPMTFAQAEFVCTTILEGEITTPIHRVHPKHENPLWGGRTGNCDASQDKMCWIRYPNPNGKKAEEKCKEKNQHLCKMPGLRLVPVAMCLSSNEKNRLQEIYINQQEQGGKCQGKKN